MAESILLPQFIPPSVDLSDYALKAHTHSQYLTSHQSLSGYATQSWVKTYVSDNGGDGSSMAGGKLFATGTVAVTDKISKDETSNDTTLRLPKAAKYICIGKGFSTCENCIPKGGYFDFHISGTASGTGVAWTTRLSSDGYTITFTWKLGEKTHEVAYFAYE